MAAVGLSSSLLSLLPITDALAVKDDFTLESAVVALRKLDARDKATKIMQYGARFFYWWFANGNPELSKRAFNLYRTTQRSRKAFRMLKVLDEFVKLRHVLRDAGKKGDVSGYLGYAEALLGARCLAMGCFWTFDNLNYLTVTETVNFGVERAQKGFSRSWGVGSALSILLGIDAFRKTDKKRRKAAAEYADAMDRAVATTDDGQAGDTVEQRVGDESQSEDHLREALKRANADHFKSWLMIFKGLVDLICAVNITGMDIPRRLTGRKLNDGIIGAAGCASALCVLYNSWPARQLSPVVKARPLARLSASQIADSSDGTAPAPQIARAEDLGDVLKV